MTPRLFRRRRASLAGQEPQPFGRHFSTRLPSADHGPYFDVRFAYAWELELP